jgi:L-ornithine Nalpha-acyltransferase
MSELEIKITTDPVEIQEAQRLRFQVFNLEMKKGLKSSYAQQLDVDEFDSFCEHLIVRDRTSREVVGTYRLMRGVQARTHIGFYSEKEFDLSTIKSLDGELLELGRSCARKDFRDRALIPLMWEEIARHVIKHRVRFLFGCGSLYTTEPQEVSAVFALLKRNHYAPKEFRVYPVQDCRIEGLRDSAIEDSQALFQKLPSLIKGYLRLGALVCGPPALDAEFGTADFFLLLDFATMKGDYLRRLGLADVKGNDEVD